ncbi:hypothetical protein OGATHE_002744 [Ogataea polymorpha]|uniref:Uncharacterized protein n=1 Tax=Ogataea polymorpha TaxID=460523 RepID=A0A9P8PDD3_9ASCO|nr:hypothetical protein OGATHE_002744 [Ogataea polymorpha]
MQSQRGNINENKLLMSAGVALMFLNEEYMVTIGICSKQTCSAYADPISIDSATFPWVANEIALTNSVVLGTNANTVNPRNFGSMGKALRTSSTTSTSISAMTAYIKVAKSKIVVLFFLDQFGASWPPSVVCIV